MSEILSIIHDDKRAGLTGTSSFGRQGEALAAKHLGQNGYRIVIANFKAPVGRNSKGVQVTGEIDLIALDGETLCFVEVKTRRSESFTPILTNVDLRKQRQITRTANVYRRIFDLWDMPRRFDVVSVLIPKHADPVIVVTKDFWSESKFRKRTWNYPSWKEYV